MIKKLVSLLFVILALCLIKSPANAAIVPVAGSNSTGSGCNGNPTCNITLGTHVNNELIIFGLTNAAGPVTAISSGGSSPVVCPINHGPSASCWKIWQTGDPTTYTFTGGTTAWGISSFAWTGEDLTAPIDEVTETVAGGAFDSTIYLPSVGGHFDGEMRIGVCIYDSVGSPSTPTGMTQRANIFGAAIYDLTGGPLSDTTPVPTLSCGNPSGSGVPDTGVTWLIKPASAVADTYHPVPGLACYSSVVHIHDTLDMSSCDLHDGDMVETCSEGWTATSSYGNLAALVPPAKFTASIARDYFYDQLFNGRCTYGYWHTGDPLTFTWGYDGQTTPTTGNVTGSSQYLVHRVPGGTAFLGQANQPAPTLAATSIVSQAITTTQPFTTMVMTLQSSQNSPLTSPPGIPSGSLLINNGFNCSRCNVAQVQKDAFTSGSQGTQTFTISASSNVNIYSWIVTASNPFAGLGYVSSNICLNKVNTNTISCVPPSGTTGDLLLAPVIELDDPGQSVLNAAKPAGWTLLKYQNDTSLGIVGVTTPDVSAVGLGTLQQMIVTKTSISPSGSSPYTLHGCAQTPIEWFDGGGLIGDNTNQNGTSDTLDRGLLMNSSGQWIFSAGSTSSLWTGATTLTSPLAYNDGHPHCVAGTDDGTNMRLYVDGALVAGPTVRTNSVTLPTTGFWVLDYVKQPGFFYGGAFVEGQIAVWNGTALSGAQVASIDTHMTDGTFDTAMTALSPSYWWKLKETTLPIAADSAGSNTGLYYQYRGILNQLSAGGMGDKIPYFPGSFLGAQADPGPNVGIISSTTPATAFSVSTFIQIPTNALGGGTIAEYFDGTNGGFDHQQSVFYVGSDNKLYFGMNCGNANSVVSNSTVTVNDNILHLVQGVWDGSNLKVYIDGSQSGSNATCTGTPPSHFWFYNIGTATLDTVWSNSPSNTSSGSGGPNNGGVPAYIGRVATFVNSFLSGANITSLNTHKNDGTFDTVMLGLSPTHYWKLNETHGQVATDYGSVVTNGTYNFFQTLAWALWEKTRAASESTVTFPLGDNVIAQGTIIDVSNVFNTIDGINFYDNSGLNTTAYSYGQLLTPTNDLELNLIGGNGAPVPPSGTAIPPAGTPGIFTLQNVNFGTYGFTGPTVPDTAFDFDGSTDFWFSAVQQSNIMLSALTQVLAFKTTSTSGGQMLIIDHSQTSSPNGDYVPSIWMDNAGHVYCSFFSGTATTIGSSGTFNDGNPHIVACTSTGSGSGTLTLYMDGSSAGSTATSGSSGFAGYYRVGGDGNALGAYNTGSVAVSSQYLNGTIGQAAIWKGTALTSGQIASLTTHISDGTFDAVLAALTPSYWWKMADTAPNQPVVIESVAGTNYGIYQGNAISAYVGAAPYQSTFTDIGGLMYASGNWNLGENILLPEGIPPIPGGGQIMIIIGQ